MTKEEAILRLKRQADGYYPKLTEALNIAIKALEKEPCEDAVSRQAVLDCAYAYGNGFEPEGYCVDVEDIQKLPSVTPQAKNGYLMIDDVMSVFDEFMCEEVDEEGKEIFLEMLRDKAESEVKE